MKTIKSLALICIFLTGLGLTNSLAQESPTLYAVLFKADNCSDSKSIAPKVKDLHNKLEGQKVDFVTFDFSTAKSTKRTQDLANKLGLKNVLTSHKGTGFVVLADAKSKAEKAILTSNQSVDAMLAIVKKYL